MNHFTKSDIVFGINKNNENELFNRLVITQIPNLVLSAIFTILCTILSTNKGIVMSRLHFDQDIQPLSDFRAGAASFIRQINETRRPIVITQRGKGVAVVLDVELLLFVLLPAIQFFPA